ncbi:jouberin isoform X3 [Eleginops maclovinus]|uniref:jouberin isoform X3 n=1 Tax=Eleginops maclovinus TaxID=56733 RepID=UPI003080B55D
MPAGESEARAKTRERFNEVLKKYSHSDKKKSKQKPPEAQEEIPMQTLKKTPDLEKLSEQDDQEILQNIYDPEQESPRYTKNQRREELNNSRNQETSRGKRRSRRELPFLPPPQEKGGDTAEPEERGGGKEGKRKSKKGKGRGEKEAKEAEDKLLQEYQLQIAQQETKTQEEEEERSVKKKTTKSQGETQNVSLNNDVGKKKKKKLKSVVTQEAGEEDAEQDTEQENQAESKEKKKKKKKKKHAVSEEVDVDAEDDAGVQVGPEFDASLVLSVFVHRSDRLQSDLLVSHPMVKVHVVDERTGQYVRKEDSHRPVSSFYEQQNVEHVLPIITQPFDFKKNKSIIPEWREQILFNERFGYFLQQSQEEGPRVILFFEILDFMTMEEARAHAALDAPERGFRKIAWAFLKLVGTNGVLNIDSKLRLQLFCPPARAKRTTGSIEVVEWWSKFPRHKYASTLYVTVKGIKLPEHVDPCMRSMMALQEERGSTSYSELQSEATRSLLQPTHTLPPPPRWSRLPGQVCRIPNRPMLSLRGGQLGCLTLQFSHSGTQLAAACADRDAFPVIVYEIPSGKALGVLGGHLQVVYDLCWSTDNRSLLSASSDGTVREWRVEGLQALAQKVLPHPSFVYCAQYHPAAPGLVLTGGFDALLRLWRVDVPDVNGQLLQEVEGHRSFINSLCFDAEGWRMFSADNSGLILVWRSPVGEGERGQRWSVEKEISEGDLRSVPISKLQLHPNGRCLLIHARDSVLRVMDMRILAVKRYIGATNYRERVCSTFSPCGSFLLSGSEDGMAYVWNTDTGDQLAVYSELCFSTALHGVCFHPHENMVAFSAFGQGQLIQLYLHDRSVSQLEGQSLKASRSASADSRTLRNPPDPLHPPSLQDSMDQLIQNSRLALKMQSVKEQLDSVLEPHQRSSLSGTNESDKMSFIHSGRSFTPDSVTTGLNSSLPPPSLLSPHAKLQLSGSVAETLIPQAALSTQQRGFSPVGQRLIGASSLRLHRSASERVPAGGHETHSAVQQVVVSLYDYRASRSDELTLRRGDLVQVLYKDNENWWFGHLSDGQQGYFLSSYVSDQRDEEGAQAAEETVERRTPTKVSAAISSSGELRFLSEPNDTEPETQDTRVRRKKRVKKAGLPAASDAPQDSRRRGRSSDRPLPHRPSGHSNTAFTPDT